MSDAAVYWKRYETVPSEGIDLLAEAGGIAVQGIYCEGSGDLAAMHSTPVAGDTAETIPVVAGQFLPLLANKILEGTTALPLLVLWGNGGSAVVSPPPIGGSGGSASSANQLAEIDLLEKIDVSTQLGAGWFGKAFKKILLADMTPSGIDISALAPAGMKCVAVMGSRQTLNTQTIYLEAEGNAPGVYVDLDFGRNYVQNGVWKTIGPLTTANSFPLWVVFS